MRYCFRRSFVPCTTHVSFLADGTLLWKISGYRISGNSHRTVKLKDSPYSPLFQVPVSGVISSGKMLVSMNVTNVLLNIQMTDYYVTPCQHLCLHIIIRWCLTWGTILRSAVYEAVTWSGFPTKCLQMCRTTSSKTSQRARKNPAVV